MVHGELLKQLEAAHRQFEEIDIDHSGVIEPYEFKEALENMGIEMTDQLLNDALINIGIGADEAITRDVWIKLCMSGKTLLSAEQSRRMETMAVFEAFGGKVGEGEAALNADKLGSVLEKYGVTVDLKDILKEMDGDGNAEIDFEELDRYLSKKGRKRDNSDLNDPNNVNMRNTSDQIEWYHQRRASYQYLDAEELKAVGKDGQQVARSRRSSSVSRDDEEWSRSRLDSVSRLNSVVEGEGSSGQAARRRMTSITREGSGFNSSFLLPGSDAHSAYMLEGPSSAPKARRTRVAKSSEDVKEAPVVKGKPWGKLRWLDSLARGVDNHWKEVKRVEMEKTRSVLTPKNPGVKPGAYRRASLTGQTTESMESMSKSRNLKGRRPHTALGYGQGLSPGTGRRGESEGRRPRTANTGWTVSGGTFGALVFIEGRHDSVSATVRGGDRGGIGGGRPTSSPALLPRPKSSQGPVTDSGGPGNDGGFETRVQRPSTATGASEEKTASLGKGEKPATAAGRPTTGGRVFREGNREGRRGAGQRSTGKALSMGTRPKSSTGYRS